MDSVQYDLDDSRSDSIIENKDKLLIMPGNCQKKEDADTLSE